MSKKVTPKIITLDNSVFKILFPYDPKLVAEVKQLPERSFHSDGANSHWVATCSVANVPALAEFAAKHEFVVDDLAATKLHELAAIKPQVEARLKAGRETKARELPATPHITAEHKNDELIGFVVDMRGYYPEKNACVKSAGNAKFDSATKTWRLPFSPASIDVINRLVTDHALTLAPGLADLIRDGLNRTQTAIQASAQSDSDMDIPVPAGLSYLGYQKAGIAYAAPRNNVLIADEPGLGKTIQAIGINNIDPSINQVLLIVPASLKTNWQREWNKWDIKGLSVGVVKGGKPEHWPEEAQVVVINYDLIGKHLDRLHARQWDYLVVDEAHNLRNPKAKRTQLILGSRKRGAEVPPIPARRKALLTGTPIVNRPVELAVVVDPCYLP